MLTVAEVAKSLPANLKSSATQTLVDRINNAVSDPILAEDMRKNFISYSSVLQDGRYQIEEYLNAVMYVSHKLMGETNQDAYCKTFPQRYQALMAKGVDKKTLGAYVYAYNQGKLVQAIMEQTLTPTWVLNAHIYQQAINTQADLMANSESDMVRTTAANSLLTHLAKPKEAGPLVSININNANGLDSLNETLKKMAEQQLALIDAGVPVKDIAAQNFVDVEANDVTP